MASHNTALFAAQNRLADYSTDQELPTSVDGGGKVMRICNTHEATSIVTAVSQAITLCKLAAGVKVTGIELIVNNGLDTTSAKIGYFRINADGTLSSTGSDDDRWGSGVDLSVAGRYQFVTSQADANYVTTTEVAVVLTPVTDDMAADVPFTFIIDYII